ncbi:MAG: hypothetical protein KKB24_04485, partial [Candidatus Altiarchaeota archaeon]|nr:hypothetical protein [Candidatus Altiarchaeota archaeon]
RAFIITNISLSSLKDNSEKCDESIPNVDMTVEVYDPDGELMGNKLTFDVTQEDLNKGYSFVPKNVVSTYWEDEIPVWKTFKSGTYKIIVKPGMTDINFIHYYENGEGEKSPGEWIEPVEVLSSWEKKFREEDKTFQDYVKGAIDKNQKTAEIWHIGDTEIQGKIKTYAFWALVVGIIGLLINWRRRNH